MLPSYKKEFIHHLFETGVIKFGEFKLKSGRISPYFINMGLAMKDGEGCSKVGTIYAQAIWDNLGDNFDYIHGPAYKGIPLASLVAEKLWEQYGVNKRWGYDRKESKNYGDTAEKLIVGNLQDADRVLIVDDVITTGKTKVDNWQRLSTLKKILPVGIFIAVDRQELTRDCLNVLMQHGLKIFKIVEIREVFEYLLSKKLITEEIFSQFDKYIKQFRESGNGGNHR